MKILVHYPYSNPYGALLYAAMQRERGDVTVALVGGGRLDTLAFPAIAAVRRLRGFRIAHLHWLDFSLPQRIPMHDRLSLAWSRVCIATLRLLGYRIVWTVHNVVPHERRTSNDFAVARDVARTAAAVIVHSRQTVEQMRVAGLRTERTTVVPHASYVGVYPAEIEAGDARAQLGIGADDFVVLFFGAVRRYKGVEDLVAAFTGLRLPHARLLVVGRCDDDPAFCDALERLAGDGVDMRLGYVDDRDVASYFAAADAVCLPFRSLTTSGSALLALSFGRPIVAPRIGSVADLPRDVGWLYDPDDPDGLANSLLEAAADPERRAASGRAALDYARSLTWEASAARTLDVYRSVLHR